MKKLMIIVLVVLLLVPTLAMAKPNNNGVDGQRVSAIARELRGKPVVPPGQAARISEPVGDGGMMTLCSPIEVAGI